MAAIDAPDRTRLTVALVGAECSGKTTLAQQLGHGLGAPWVPEYARAHLAGRTRYTEADVLAIARGQRDAEHALTRQDHRLVVVDTDLVVIKVWSEVRYGRADPWIDAALREDLADPRRRLYLLPKPDFPWVGDPLREHPDDRDRLHARYLTLLTELGVVFVELAGSKRARLNAAKAAVLEILRR